MKTMNLDRVVDDVRLPLVKGGFRTGWATAVVNGQRRRLFTTSSAYAEYGAHLAEVTERFALGDGETAST